MFFNVLICKILSYNYLYKSLYSSDLYQCETNCKSRDREDMLLYQGVLAFELFTGVKADKDLVEAMRQGLKES